MKLFNVFFGKIRKVLLQALRQGWTPSQISLALALGATIGIFPIYGITTPMLALTGIVARLNHAVLQSVNWLVAPLKVALILPQIRIGEALLRESEPFRLSLSEFTLQFQAAPLETVQRFSMTFLHAAIGWFLLAPVSILLIYTASRMMFSVPRFVSRDISQIHAHPRES